MKLRRRFSMHARMQGGALYAYDLIDEDGAVVGSQSSHINKCKSPWTETHTYRLGDLEFKTKEEVIDAFEKLVEQRRRDAEWSAAAPKEGNQ